MRNKVCADKPMLKRIVRVATNNNFNCTKEEFEQLKGLELSNPSSMFFINSNILTPGLLRINEYPYKAVITVNPNLTVVPANVEKLYKLNREKVAFVRVKYIPESPAILDLVTALAKDDYAVVITVQRWNKTASLEKFAQKSNYVWNNNRFRLAGKAVEDLQNFVDSFENEKVFLCDRVGGGCKTCKLCLMMTFGINLKLASINLSSSGLCMFSCPDCYAKTMQARCIDWHNKPMIFDKIKSNTKQAGRTAHIKESLKQLGR